MFGRDRGERQRHREIERQGGKKNPKQSWVAQQVNYINVNNAKLGSTSGKFNIKREKENVSRETLLTIKILSKAG
jgi:hypothetical protein